MAKRTRKGERRRAVRPRSTRPRRGSTVSHPRRRATPRVVVILSAYPRRAAAERAARSLVRSRHLACATVTDGGRAFYRWHGKERAEVTALLWGKTVAALARATVEAIRASHPDRVPEILVLPVAGGHVPYLAWL